MTNDRAALVKGRITLPDGRITRFTITYDVGYQQYGADTETLGRTQPIVDAITTALYDEELLDRGPDEDDEEQARMDAVERQILEEGR